jgi:serine/threonine protein kinase
MNSGGKNVCILLGVPLLGTLRLSNTQTVNSNALKINARPACTRLPMAIASRPRCRHSMNNSLPCPLISEAQVVCDFRHLRDHDNIVKLLNVIPQEQPGPTSELYLIFEYMPSDLSKFIRSGRFAKLVRVTLAIN